MMWGIAQKVLHFLGVNRALKCTCGLWKVWALSHWYAFDAPLTYNERCLFGALLQNCTKDCNMQDFSKRCTPAVWTVTWDIMGYSFHALLTPWKSITKAHQCERGLFCRGWRFISPQCLLLQRFILNNSIWSHLWSWYHIPSSNLLQPYLSKHGMPEIIRTPTKQSFNCQTKISI